MKVAINILFIIFFSFGFQSCVFFHSVSEDNLVVEYESFFRTGRIHVFHITDSSGDVYRMFDTKVSKEFIAGKLLAYPNPYMHKNKKHYRNKRKNKPKYDLEDYSCVTVGYKLKPNTIVTIPFSDFKEYHTHKRSVGVSVLTNSTFFVAFATFIIINTHVQNTK